MISKCLAFFVVVERTILWHAGEQSLYLLHERKVSKGYRTIVHQMHIPTDWYKQMKKKKKKVKNKLTDTIERIDQRSQWVEL